MPSIFPSEKHPRPSLEPQSADIRFWVLPNIAESAYLSRSLCWWLPDVSACNALSGVRSGVKWRQPVPLPGWALSHRGPHLGWHPDVQRIGLRVLADVEHRYGDVL